MSLSSLMLFDATEIGCRVSWRVILPTVGITAGLFLFVITVGIRALAPSHLDRPAASDHAIGFRSGIALETPCLISSRGGSRISVALPRC